MKGTNSRSHVGTAEFKEMNWLPEEHKVAQMKLNLVYKIVNGSAPEYLQNDFNHVSQTHRYSTRHSVSSLCIPSIKSAGKASFAYSAIKLWNELPKEIKNINRENRFKAAVKSFLFEKMQQRDQSDFVISRSFFLKLSYFIDFYTTGKISMNAFQNSSFFIKK